MPTLTWTGKDKVINHHQEVPFRVLEHQYGFNASTGQTNQETGSGNKIIHGDNLLALKTLLPEYEGRIKCIYIDPPYNTGNEGWVYNDNVNDPKIKKWLGEVVGREGEDLNRHDKWLCMMFPRIKLLHKLLSEDGVIFVSIDDIEVCNLRLILDEIFGRANFVAQFVWKSRVSEDARSKTGVSNDHEYILCYKKSETDSLRGVEKDLNKFSNPDNDPRGPWRSADLTGLATREQRPNLHYDLIDPATGIVYPCPPKGWRYDINTMTKRITEGRILFPENINGRPRNKLFIEEMESKYKAISSLITQTNTSEGTREINEILGNGVFQFPKPFSLVRILIEQIVSDDKEAFILDSFAGSGTAAHAVLNLNKQDGGNRKFILVEMEDYAETITAERVRRVIKGYGDTEGAGGEFDYYELGPALFRAEGELNEEIPVEKIRNYVFYTETKSPLIRQTESNNPYFLEKWHDTGYYFYYEKDRITTLDMDFLATIDVAAEQHLIYADQCLLEQDFLVNNRIIFKKIPRDITRF